jgi:predicted regulator of Ras-like GTPase activity (Roadblock/LC7/MglB family)
MKFPFGLIFSAGSRIAGGLVAKVAGMRGALIALTVGLAIGGAVGAYTHQKFVAASQVAAMKRAIDLANEARNNDAKELEIQREKSAKLSEQIAKSDASIDALKKEIKRHAPKPRVCKPAAAPRSPDAAPGPGVELDHRPVPEWTFDPFLTRGELWLLDLARANRAIDHPAPFGNGEGTEPSDVAWGEFLESDLEVVKRFYRLKKKHDELVDYVRELQRKQRERLGASE